MSGAAVPEADLAIMGSGDGPGREWPISRNQRLRRPDGHARADRGLGRSGGGDAFGQVHGPGRRLRVGSAPGYRRLQRQRSGPGAGDHGADGAVGTVRARHYLVATGSAPWVPPIDGMDGVGHLTSTTAMELEELPASMLVLGGGYVALEQAQLFARLGCRVTVLARSRLLSGEKPEVGADWMPQYNPYLEDDRTGMCSLHKVYGPEANDRVLQLRKGGIDKVVLAGMSANLCVENHLRELLEQGFKVVVADATGTAVVRTREDEDDMDIAASMISAHPLDPSISGVLAACIEAWAEAARACRRREETCRRLLPRPF